MGFRNLTLLDSYGFWPRIGKALAVILAVVLLSVPAVAERLTLLAFGDSLTQGFGLVEQEGFVPQLQRWLDARGADAEVINGGVSGDTTAGGAARINWSLSDDVDAMILALGGNDMLRGLQPEEAKANLERIIEAAHAQDVVVLLVGMTAPLNYGPDYKATFESAYVELASEHKLMLEKSFLGALGDDPAGALALMQSDGVHPNAQGVAKIIEKIGPRALELLAKAR